jgi:murein DD-endopeptidase MepM/ murein hydrolase activator NlpD
MRLLITAVALIGMLVSADTVAAAPDTGARIPAEANAAPAPARFGWPLADPHVIARPFTAPETAYGPGHRGVDLVGEVGQSVLTAGPGMVLYAGRMVDRDVVSIEHPGGLRTTYEPVSAAVTVGEQVTQGQRIGNLQPGHPECAAPVPKACLHWGARRRLHYLDPMRLLGHGRVRLLPWDATR